MGVRPVRLPPWVGVGLPPQRSFLNTPTGRVPSELRITPTAPQPRVWLAVRIPAAPSPFLSLCPTHTLPPTPAFQRPLLMLPHRMCPLRPPFSVAQTPSLPGMRLPWPLPQPRLWPPWAAWVESSPSLGGGLPAVLTPPAHLEAPELTQPEPSPHSPTLLSSGLRLLARTWCWGID